MLRRDPPVEHGHDGGFPFVCAEPGGGDARVGDVQDGGREGGEGGRGVGREVDYLFGGEVRLVLGEDWWGGWRREGGRGKVGTGTGTRQRIDGWEESGRRTLRFVR